MELSLPKEKVCKLHKELESFEGRKKATKHQIQRLCGVLSHCCKVVKGARTFSHQAIDLLDLLKGLEGENPRIT